MIGLKVSDFSLLHWESDWSGDEVGLDCEIAGLWKVPASDRSPELYMYVDVESCEVLEVWTLEDAEDEVDGYEEFDTEEPDTEGLDTEPAEDVLGPWFTSTWVPGGGEVN